MFVKFAQSFATMLYDIAMLQMVEVWMI